MKTFEIAKVLDEISPPSLAYVGEELGFIAGDPEKEVKTLGVTERPTLKVLQEAVDKHIDMLVIHEPIYHSEKVMFIDKSTLTFSPNTKRKELVEKGNLVIFRYHSQWDDAYEGNNETLAKILGIEDIEKIPYGRIGTINETTLENLSENIKQKLGCENVLVVGDINQKITKVAVVAGSGNSMIEIMDYVKSKNAQVLISGDLQDGRARYAEEIELSIIDAGDYYTENPGANHLVQLLKEKLPEVNVLSLDPGKPWSVI